MTGDRAAIGRDGGQDTQGAWQGSYQVTIRPTGRCALGDARTGRQLNAGAHHQTPGGGEIESKSQAGSNDTESEDLE
jgi:hypothetical protein